MFKQIVDFVDSEGFKKYTGRSRKIHDNSELLFIKDNDDPIHYENIESFLKCSIDEKYKTIVENKQKYINSKPNKALGAQTGLLTFLPIFFKLKKGFDINSFKIKAKKTKFPQKNTKDYDKNGLNLSDEEIERIEKALLKWNKSTIENNKKSSKVTKDESTNKITKPLFVLKEIKDDERFDAFIKKADDYIYGSEAVHRNEKSIKGICNVCNNSGDLIEPNLWSTASEKKSFLKHITMYNDKENQNSLLLCRNCNEKIKKFQEYLRDEEIRLFPLFFDNRNYKNINLDLSEKEAKETFKYFFNKFSEDNESKKRYNFYLIISPNKDIIYFDYIFNFKWILDDIITNIFEPQNNNINGQKTRIDIENYLLQSIGLSPEKNINRSFYFFIPKKIKDNGLKNLILTYREFIFNYVYRADNSFFKQDNNLNKFLIEGLEFKLKKDYKKKTKPNEFEAFFILYFNKNKIFK